MRRRTFLAALGVTAAGGAVGTGAFTSVEAERTVNVAIADEDEALLALEPNDDTFASANSNRREAIQLSFDALANGGGGPGSQSEYVFDRVFTVRNQGTQTVYVQASFSERNGLDEEISPSFYVADADEYLLEQGDSAVAIPSGESADIGTEIDTDEINAGLDEPGKNFTFEATISAVSEKPGDATIVDLTGTPVDSSSSVSQ